MVYERSSLRMKICWISRRWWWRVTPVIRRQGIFSGWRWRWLIVDDSRTTSRASTSRSSASASLLISIVLPTKKSSVSWRVLVVRRWMSVRMGVRRWITEILILRWRAIIGRAICPIKASSTCTTRTTGSGRCRDQIVRAFRVLRRRGSWFRWWTLNRG